MLYATFLADIGTASATVSSYMSAIRYVLKHDDIEVDNNCCKLASIIRGCKLHNDVVSVRLPIGMNLLKLILQEIERDFLSRGQPYLSSLYKAMTTMGYYGLMRVSELVGKHAVAADDVKISKNLLKRKVKVILRSSKTHRHGQSPQILDIIPEPEVLGSSFCPYNVIAYYTQIRPRRTNVKTQFFTFSDGSKVTERHFRTVLLRAIRNLGLPSDSYNTHSLRIGRACTLFKRNVPVTQIRKIGRWKTVSTAFKYFK